MKTFSKLKMDNNFLSRSRFTKKAPKPFFLYFTIFILIILDLISLINMDAKNNETLGPLGNVI